MTTTANPLHGHAAHDDKDDPVKPKAAAPAKKCTIGELKTRVKEALESTGGHDRNIQEIAAMCDNLEKD